MRTGTITDYRFQPYTVFTNDNDMPTEYSDYTEAIFRNATLATSSFLGRLSRCILPLVARFHLNSRDSYLTRAIPLLILDYGSPALVSYSGIIERACESTSAPFASALTAAVASIPISTGAAIRTVHKRAGDIIPRTARPAQVPLGIMVSADTGSHYAWVGFALLMATVVLHTIKPVSFSCLKISFCPFRHYPQIIVASG